MRTLKKLTTDSEVNEALKSKSETDILVLYHSLWDKRCAKILEMAEKWAQQEGDETLYLINSWDTPECFSSFSITSVPSLLTTKNGRVSVQVEYSNLYQFFRCETEPQNHP